MIDLVTVVIPAFNAARTIRQAVDSALSQTWPHIEIVVVDDCSLDETCSVVESITDSRVRLIKLATNGGGSVARNAGIDAAEGKFVSFLDADDHWAIEKTSAQMATLSSSKNPENTIIYNAISMVMDDKTVTRPTYAWTDQVPLDEYIIIDRQLMQTSGFLLSTDLARKVRFDGSLRKYQDTDFVFSLHQAKADFVFCSAETVFFDSSSTNTRVSLSKKPERTLRFLEKWDGVITQRTKAFYMLCAVAPMTISQNPIKGAMIYLKWFRYAPPIMKDVVEAAILWVLPLPVYNFSRSLFHRLRGPLISPKTTNADC